MPGTGLLKHTGELRASPPPKNHGCPITGSRYRGREEERLDKRDGTGTSDCRNRSGYCIVEQGFSLVRGEF